MDFIILIILLVTAIAQFVIAILSFINGGLVRKTIFAAIVMLLGAVWTFIFSNVFPLTETNVVLINQVVIIIGVILFYFVSLLGLSFLDIKAKKFYLLALLMSTPVICTSVAAVLNIGLFFPSLYVDGDTVHLEANFATLGMTVVMMVAYVGTAVAALIVARKRATTKLGKKLIRNVIIGIIIGFLFPVIFNIANAEVHEAHMIGPFGLLAMALLSYSALVKHGDDQL